MSTNKAEFVRIIAQRIKDFYRDGWDEELSLDSWLHEELMKLAETWHPLSTCPENTQVLFGWPDGRRWAGMTAIGSDPYDLRKTRRYFHGKGINAFNPDDNPPTRWCVIPAWEKEGE